jgi:signal transduction histidine kinase
MPGQIELLIQIYTHSPVPISIADDNLSIVWSNAATIKNYPALSLPGGLSLLFSHSQIEQLAAALAARRAPILLPLAAMPHLAMSFTPLSEGYLLQFCLFETQGVSMLPQSPDYLTSTFTNQLRAPLSNVFASVFSIANLPEAQENERLRELVGQISENSYHILRFTIDLTRYLRYMLGNESYDPSLINLGELLHKICQAAMVLTESVGIPLSFTLPKQPVVLEADSELLTFALVHLISNSCRFTREGNQIELSLSVNDGNAVVAVSDRGLGIPSHLTTKVFEPFFSYDHEGRPFAGSGLGLTIVRHIVAQHRGSVAVTSAQETGTTVAISLPLFDSGSLALKSPPLVADLLRDRFSLLHVILSDSCGVPLP